LDLVFIIFNYQIVDTNKAHQSSQRFHPSKLTKGVEDDNLKTLQIGDDMEEFHKTKIGKSER
jgi:hypothetical protein